jgi:hypothetical protein
VWSFGALLAMVDSGTGPRVRTIASVSGGSFAHGVVAQDVELATAGADDFERAVGPMTRMIAHDGLFLWGPSTNRYSVADFALMGTGSIGVLVGGTGLVWWRGSTGWAVVAVVAAAALAAGLWWAEQRGRKVADALGRLYFSRHGRRTRLGDLHAAVDHVFCATELQSGEFFYLRPSGLVSYAFGTAPPGDLELATVVQISACVPAGFPPHVLDTATMGFHRSWPAPRVPARPDRAVLVDGGVYDNMAEEWFRASSSSGRSVLAGTGSRTLVDEVVVVNASARDEWQPYRDTWIPGLREWREVMRSQNVTYDAVGSERRRSDISEWTRSGVHQRGALVHIAQSPVTVPRAFLSDAHDEARGAEHGARDRAAAALDWLRAPPHADPWAELVESNLQVPTTLSKIGAEHAVDLLEHAYLLTAVNLHVLLGHPLPGAIRPDRDRFRRIVEGTTGGAPAGR